MSERDRAVEVLVEGFRTLIKRSELYTHYDETPGKDITEKIANSRLYFEPWADTSVAEKKGAVALNGAAALLREPTHR